MTCVAGFVHGDDVYIGADSAGCRSWDITVRADEKVFRKGQYLIGFCGSFRMGDVLRYHMEYTDASGADDIREFLVTKFVPNAREAMKAAGYAKVSDNVETGGEFLVGVRGRLFNFQPDFQVAEPAVGYDAIGCGHAYAKGCLFTDLAVEPQERVLQALRAAGEHSNGVRQPFLVLSTEGRASAK